MSLAKGILLHATSKTPNIHNKCAHAYCLALKSETVLCVRCSNFQRLSFRCAMRLYVYNADWLVCILHIYWLFLGKACRALSTHRRYVTVMPRRTDDVRIYFVQFKFNIRHVYMRILHGSTLHNADKR